MASERRRNKGRECGDGEKRPGKSACATSGKGGKNAGIKASATGRTASRVRAGRRPSLPRREIGMRSGAAPFKEDGGEGGKGEGEGVGAAHPGMFTGIHATEIADIGAAVDGGVRIEDFLVVARPGNAHAVAVADDGSGAEQHDNELVGISAVAHEGIDAIVGIVGVEPFKTLPVRIDFVESGFRSEQAVKIADQALHALMGLVFE